MRLRYRAEWLGKITEAGVRGRAKLYYQQFDANILRQHSFAPVCQCKKVTADESSSCLSDLGISLRYCIYWTNSTL
jgi:hypothetical protein